MYIILYTCIERWVSAEGARRRSPSLFPDRPMRSASAQLTDVLVTHTCDKPQRPCCPASALPPCGPVPWPPPASIHLSVFVSQGAASPSPDPTSGLSSPTPCRPGDPIHTRISVTRCRCHPQFSSSFRLCVSIRDCAWTPD